MSFFVSLSKLISKPKFPFAPNQPRTWEKLFDICTGCCNNLWPNIKKNRRFTNTISHFTRRPNSARNAEDKTKPFHYKTGYEPSPKKTPELIYIPRILRWMKVKMKLRFLKKWDPDFTEGAFIYGSLKALCRITEIIHEEDPEELIGLLTEPARIKLTNDMTRKLTNLQKEIIKLRMNDIKILVPVSVNFRQNSKEKQCDIAVRSLALKWLERKGLHLVLVALEAEFSRDYREGVKPEWIISNFDVLECAMLNELTSKVK